MAFSPAIMLGGLVVNKTIAVPAEAESLPSADPRKTRLAGLPICETTFMAKDLQQYHVKTRQTKQSVTIYLGMLTTPGSLLRQPVDLSDHTTHHLSYEVYVGRWGNKIPSIPPSHFRQRL